MFSPKLLNIILALQVLAAIGIYVQALPITSKPIEGTAEHLAWQAWLMLPPEQKSLEKSRKVTPKSIFTLPFRECPQGHQLFENRCIPTVNIDQDKLLTQELLVFLPDDGNMDNNYDYDYRDDGVEEVLYDTAQRLSGGIEGNNETYNFDQLPSQDVPLKFNLFQEKYPTDTDGGDAAPSSEERETLSSAKSANGTTLVAATTAVNVSSTVQASSVNTTQTKNSTAAVVDLQMESTNVSTNIVPAAVVDGERHDSHDIVTPTTAFSISDIDAIALSAVAVVVPTQSQTQDVDLEQPPDAVQNTQNVHKFSLFKDDSSVHLVTSALLNEHNTNERTTQPDLSLLLKADDLLPLSNIAAGLTDTAATLTATATTTSKTTTRTRTRTIPPFSGDNEVPTLSTSFTSSISDDDTTTPLSSVDDEVTDLMLSEAESTMPTLLADLLGNDEKVAEVEETDDNAKEEHPRSVEAQNEDIDSLAAQEGNFKTTTEPDATTSFQLDETTVDEAHDAPTIALKELLDLELKLKLAQHPSDRVRENLGLGIVKKSKVEPVELPPPIEPYDSVTEQHIMPTTLKTTATTTTATIPTTVVKVSASTMQQQQSTATATTAAPTAETPSPAITTDRFDDSQHSSVSSENKHQEVFPANRNSTTVGQDKNANDEQQRHDSSNLRNITEKTKTTTTATTTTSEIDIEQELRMINELVKGDKRQQQSKGGIIKSTTTAAQTTSESGFTSADEKSTTITTTASVSNNDDNISGSTPQLISSIEEESRIAVKTTQIAITTPKTTTPPTTVEPTATIWSKIMPLLGFSASIDETTTTVKTPRDVNKNGEMLTSPSNTSNANVVGSTTMPTIKSSINSNRSNRNSKIIRINNLSTTSFSSNGRHSNNHSSNSGGNSIAADKLITTSSTQSTSTTLTPTTTTTVSRAIASEDAETSEGTSSTLTSSSSSSSERNSTPRSTDQGEPFWWLPIGWRLDRPNDDEPSLLFRFWSTFPGNGLTNDHQRE